MERVRGNRTLAQPLAAKRHKETRVRPEEQKMERVKGIEPSRSRLRRSATRKRGFVPKSRKWSG